MPLFQNIAFNEDVPVIHARRKDGVIVIATRVPLKDMLPERWGWILILGGKGEIIEHDDIEALYDNMGRRYPKVYLRADMFKYIETWGCVEWEAGYSDGKAALIKDSSFPDPKQFKEDLLQDITSKYQEGKEEQIQSLRSIIEAQTQQLIDNEQEKCVEIQKQVSENDAKLLQQMLSIQGHNQQHWEDLEEKIVEGISRSKEEINDGVKNAILEQYTSGQKIERLITQIQTSFLEKIESQSAQMQATLLEKIEQKPHLSEKDLSDYLDKLEQKQLEQLDTLMGAVKNGQERIVEIKDLLVPIEVDDGSTNMDDEIKKLSKSAKTLSERYITSIINTNTRYHNTFDKQVKDSFKLTRFIIFVGVGLFILTVISFLVTFLFHSDEITLITNGVGALLSAIVTGLGGLNKLHDDAADRQLKALANLSNSVKATHAQFMIEQIQDEAWKRTQFERVLNQYLSDNREK